MSRRLAGVEQISMRHSIEELRQIIYHYYPRIERRDVPGYGQVPDLVNPPPSRRRDLPADAWPPAGHDETEEHRRLAARRVETGENRHLWTPFIRRIRERFPGQMVNDTSMNLLNPDGDGDSGYAGSLALPPRTTAEEDHKLGFVVSFLAPYYVIWGSAWSVEPGGQQPAAPEPDGARPLHEEGRSVLYLPDREPSGGLGYVPLYDVHFDLTPDEQSFAEGLIEILAGAFPDYERMPPEVGLTSVKDVYAPCRAFGQANLYDCLFTTAW